MSEIDNQNIVHRGNQDVQSAGLLYTENKKTKKQEIQEQYNVSEIGIFGSFVRGESTDASDIDILVDFETPIDLFQFLELEEYLSNLTGERVDIVSRKALKPAIGKRIQSEVLYL